DSPRALARDARIAAERTSGTIPVLEVAWRAFCGLPLIGSRAQCAGTGKARERSSSSKPELTFPTTRLPQQLCRHLRLRNVAQRPHARFRVTVEHLLDVVEEPVADRLVPGVARVEVIALVAAEHRPADHDVALAAEQIGDDLVLAAAAEQVFELAGVFEHDQVSTAGFERLIVEQRLRAEPGAVDDDGLGEGLDLMAVAKLPPPDR